MIETNLLGGYSRIIGTPSNLSKSCLLIRFLVYTAFTIVSNSDCLWKSGISVSNIVIWHNKSILSYN
jgi:hypothetical protein